MLKKLIKILLCFFVIITSHKNSFGQAQGTQTEFGKNRVQFKDFQWFYYRSSHFDTYYYKNGKEMGAMVGKIAEQNLKEIENILDYKLAGRIKILAYNKYSDLVQTNLGLVTDQQQNTGGVTQIVGNKLFIYFDGNTSHLYKQIRAGIAQVLINELLYGGNFQEKLSNSTLLTLPDWFLPGLTSYIAEEWNVQLDNELKDGINSGRYKKFNRIAEKDATVAGHSIWKYVVDNFGLASISNIVYMTRVNRNAESGFLYIVGLNFKELGPVWLEYYKKQYEKQDVGKTLPSKEFQFSHKKKKRTTKFKYDQFKISPDAKKYAYIINRNGRFTVYIYDLETEKTKKVFRTGMKSNSFISETTDPILSWHPSSLLLAVSYEKKSMPCINILNLADKKENVLIKMYKYEKILDFDYSSDGRRWVLSAIRNGQSDLYLYDIPSRRDEQLTNDWYDDLNPRYFERSNKIVFSSNRINDSLKKETYSIFSPVVNYDLFEYNLMTRSIELKRLTKTPYITESNPIELDTSVIAYLSDESGVINRSALKLDSTIDYIYDTTIFYYDTTIVVYKDSFVTTPLTNYSRNIINQDISKRSKRITDILSNIKQTQLFIIPNKQNVDSINLKQTPFSINKKKNQEQKLLKVEAQRVIDSTQKADSIYAASIKDSIIIVGDSTFVDTIANSKSYFFQSEFPRKKTDNTIAIKQKTNKGYSVIYVREKKENKSERIISLENVFSKSAPIPYLPEFSTSYLVSQIDNSLISNTYQQFTGVGPIFVNSSVNALIKVGTADLMEDYRFTGGFRLAGNLTIPEYFLSFENLKKRIDKQIIFYKQGGDEYQGIDAVRTNSYEFKYISKYPFNEQSAIKATIFYRRDERIILSTDSFSLNQPNFYNNNLGYRIEYIFDNTIYKGLNLYNGTRYKIYAEQFIDIDNTKNNMINLGFDARHYQKISRQIIFAGRFAASTSIADQKVMYYLGGVDSWIIPRFNNNIQIDQTRNYKYQALATNLRGFTQNIRNGNSFVVANTEIRVPVFAYFLNRPIKSDFVKNFQLVPFADVGAAWLGTNPFSDENRFNKIDVQGPPVIVKVVEPKFPIVGGFGWGARSRLLGYFIRFDMAWGVQNSMVEEKPVYYVSLSLDF